MKEVEEKISSDLFMTAEDNLVLDESGYVSDDER